MGMQAQVGEYATKDYRLIQSMKMSKIGTVDKADCDTLLFDPANDEHITSITLRWGKTHITKISVSCSTGQILSRGFTTGTYVETILTF